VTASKGLTTRIKPAGERSKQHRGAVDGVIYSSPNKYFNNIEGDGGDWYQLSHQAVNIAQNAALDTLTRLAVQAK
jgi:hypothetical protein